jgi:hypothetical protein
MSCRFWGTPIPLWTSEDGEERIAIGSVEQLETLSGVKVHTPHYDTLILQYATYLQVVTLSDAIAVGSRNAPGAQCYCERRIATHYTEPLPPC